MSLSRTIDRLARAIRQEARRNRAFAERLEKILAAHVSRAPDQIEPQLDGEEAALPAAPTINPIALVSREGAAALCEILRAESFTKDLMRALVSEHNLDPAGETGDLDREALAAHIVAQAQRRVERDRKLFDY